MFMIWFCSLLGALVLLAALRWAVHRSLAPERVVAGGTPAELGLRHEEVRITTENGKSLSGWLIPAEQNDRTAAVVILHGWGGNAGSMLPLAPHLHRTGFTILLVDARCHGRSDEDSFASMPRFAEDLGHAIDWLKARSDVDPQAISVVGHSVGAGAALLAAAERHDIATVVSIAAFTHPAAMMKRWLESKGIPFRPLGWLLLSYVEWVIGRRFDDIAPVNTIRRVRCPTLLVHGGGDQTVPVAEAHAIHAARTGEHVQLKVVAGSHDDYADLDRELPALAEFLRRHAGRPASVPAA
jgi:uncharacterized protein